MRRRRAVLMQGGALALLVAGEAFGVADAVADEASPFDAKTLADALARLGSAPVDSRERLFRRL